MFIVSKSLLISSATMIVRTGGAIWLNPLAACVGFCTHVAWVCLVCLLLCKEVSAIIERRDMDLVCVFIGFHMCGIL